VIHALFKDYDTNRDGLISEAEFNELGMTLWAPRENPGTVRGKSGRGSSERIKMAHMIQGMWRCFDKKGSGYMTLAQLLKAYYPHLSNKDCKRVVSHYVSHQPVPPVTTLREKLANIPGALEDIRDIFDHWDKNKDGLVEWSDLSDTLSMAGIDRETATTWLHKEATSSESKNGEQVEGGLQRRLSHLDLSDMEILLASNYLGHTSSADDPSSVLDAWLNGKPIGGLGYAAVALGTA